MKYPSNLIPGKLIKRYKRFLADIILDNGQIITAHCANPGAMINLKTPGSKVWVSRAASNIKRKLHYDWQLIIDDTNQLVGINTQIPNKLVAQILLEKKIPEFIHYQSVKSEIKYGQQNSRIDFLLQAQELPDCYLEVKNVTHQENNIAYFPDAVTTRGKKHLEELIYMISQGHRAIVLYITQRMDCAKFSVAEHIDPDYAKIAYQAKLVGVEFLCYKCAISLQDINIDKKMEIIDN